MTATTPVRAPLPARTTGSFTNGDLRCPWCGAHVEAATVTVESLLFGWCCHGLTNGRRERDGAGDPHGVEVTCPECRKPSMILLQHVRGERAVELWPIRTEADLRLLRERPA